MPNLTTRVFDAEIMDDFTLPDAEIAPVLEGLGKVNSWFGGHKNLIGDLKKFPVKDGYAVSDWGCGGGDSLIAIAKWAIQNQKQLTLTGIDAAPAAINFARHASGSFNNISYTQADVINEVDKIAEHDIIISSLFTHHFDDEDWVRLIKNMYSKTRKGIVITDLHRHWVLYYAVILITHVLTRNKMVRVDGPLSVKRSFKKAELLMLLKKAQIDNFNLTWKWPFRWTLVIYKP
jgi:2-polyprenyl-3-methyl-5-hydroxy-6-metoxy-1,4-benzoquinol methylase